MSNKILLIFFLLISSVSIVCNSSCVSTNPADLLRENIEYQIENLIQLNQNIDAVSAAIVTPDGKFKVHKGKLLNGQKPNDETLYEIASITKTFTGLLLSYAIVEKDIKIDDDIRTHLPPKFTDSLSDSMSYRHLATHRSGLPLFFPYHEELFESTPNWDKLPFEINQLQIGFSKNQFFESLGQYEFQNPPGVNTLYSNAGTNLVGYLLESIYNDSFENLLKNKILSPLKMVNTTISLSKTDQNFLAKGYNENRIEMPFRVEKQMNAEGGIVSNVDDMMKYLIYHLNSNSEVLKVAHMRLINEEVENYHEGLFWQLKKEIGKPDLLYQIGGAYGISSWISIIPELKVGIFIVTNTSGSYVHQKLEETVDKILDP